MTVGLYFKENTNGQLRMDMPGPDKVVYNLIKGLQSMNVDYLINQDGDVNVILQNVSRLYGDLSNCFLGPNIATLPIDVTTLLNYNSYRKIIVPSMWVKNLYSQWIPIEKIEVWSAGIDTIKFNEKSEISKEYDFLIYYKRRGEDELSFVKQFLLSKNMNYLLLEYGKYTDIEFIDKISKCRYGFILDNTESQGIAIQEMMSCNIPLIVWDKNSWNDRNYNFPATSIPYFSSLCGEYFTQQNEIDSKFETFLQNTYNPREFILSNLSIEKSTNELIKIIELL